MRTFETDGARLAFETVGIGDPLVLIPGFASGTWSWKHQVGPLSEHFRIIVLDPRGIANSERGEVPGTIEQIADDVAALLDHLGLGSAHVLGISFGGFVAQEFAVRHRSKTRKLVLACTSYGGAGHVAPSPEFLIGFTSTTGLNSPARIRQYLARAFQEDFLARDPDVFEAFCEARERNMVPEDVYLEQLKSAMSFDFADAAKSIDVETLILSGDADTIVPVDNSRNLASVIPDAELKIVEGAGHMFFVERADAFNQAVVDFLKK